MKMSDKTYDVLKWIQRLLLPALATLYLALGSIWKDIIYLPYPEQVAATITAIDTFLGVILGISSANYYKEQEAQEGSDGKL
ncbi:MAG: phage holin [Oscillospiraceae bacterium]|nr:phage holin [Oscillospiraceae bacterium]